MLITSLQTIKLNGAKIFKMETKEEKAASFELLIKKNGSKNLGYRTDRLSYDPKDIENAFSSHWQKENKNKTNVNSGHGILQDLFIEKRGNPFNIFNETFCYAKITNKERLIVATIIQWLGTNCGFCFLQEALDKAGYKIVKK